MDVPDSLKAKMALFGAAGRLVRNPEDLFRESSWVQVMLGQGVIPKEYHPMADRLSSDKLMRFMSDVKAIIDKAEAQLPLHADFIAAHCKADLQ
jgi:tryptophan halogenase